MMNHKACLEVKGRDERLYTFLCDPNSPLGEVYDVLQVMLKHVHNQMDEVMKKKEESSEPACEDVNG